MMMIPQSTAHRVMFMAFLTSDHLTPATGKTITMSISKNGGTFAAPSGGATATGVANGWYYIDLSTKQTETAGPLAMRGIEATIDDVGLLRQVMVSHSGLIDFNAQLAGGSAVDTAATIATAVETELGTGSSLTALATAASQTTILTNIAAVQADTDNIQTRIPAALASGRMIAETQVIATDAVSSTALAASAVTEIQSGLALAGGAMTLTSGERDAIADAYLDRASGIETGLTPRQLGRVQFAAAGGKTNGMATTTANLRNLADTKNRIQATVDADGNRSAVTLDLT